MNSIVSEYYPVFEMYQALRNQLMDVLTDDDLRYTVGGDNRTLGALCREIGEVQFAYIQSFKTFTQDFSFRTDEPGLEESVEKLGRWFSELDRELSSTMEALSEDDVQNRVIDRGGGFTLSPRVQLEVYKEALLIFYGKVSVYLKALKKNRPKQWVDWIA